MYLTMLKQDPAASRHQAAHTSMGSRMQTNHSHQIWHTQLRVQAKYKQPECYYAPTNERHNGAQIARTHDHARRDEQDATRETKRREKREKRKRREERGWQATKADANNALATAGCLPPRL